MKILITGHDNFIGSKIHDYLKNNHTILIIENLSIESLDKFFAENKDVDIVIHCANVNKNDDNEIFYNDLLIFENFVKNSDNFKFFISFGSGEEFDTNYDIENVDENFERIPQNKFGLSKHIINQRIKKLDKFINLRTFNYFGFGQPEEYESFIESNIKRYSKKEPMVSKNSTHDFFAIDDLLIVIDYCITNYESINFKSLNLCYDEKISFKQICEFINSLRFYQVEIQSDESDMKVYTGNSSKLYELGINLNGIKPSIKKILDSYMEEMGIMDKRFWISTEYPLAFMSPDHLKPWGTSRDNHTNIDLIKELEGYFGRKIKVLDLGCSGGAYIKDSAEMGNYALGLEGSDYSILNQRAEWPQLHMKNLFTCDISKPYKIFLYDSHSIEQVKFDVINAWEVVEHIHPDDLETFFMNIKNHLSYNGIFIASVSCKEEIIEGFVLHQSVFPEEHWRTEILSKYFEVFEYPFKNKLREDASSLYILLKNKK